MEACFFVIDLVDVLLAIDAFEAFEASERYPEVGFRDFAIGGRCVSICGSSKSTITMFCSFSLVSVTNLVPALVRLERLFLGVVG